MTSSASTAARHSARDWLPASPPERAACFVEQYGGYAAVDDVKLNGKLTLGENVADNGGLRIALAALRDIEQGSAGAPIDGYTPLQRFFLGWAQVWCQNVTPETARQALPRLVRRAPHHHQRWGVVANPPRSAPRRAVAARS